MTAAGADQQVDLDGAAPAALPGPIGAWGWLGIGVGAAAVGLLPWIITGMRLPLQLLWNTSTLPEQMPIALLPFSHYFITVVAGILLMGAAIAGLVARSTQARQGRRGFAALTAGLLGAQLIAVVQTTVVVGLGLSSGTGATTYLVAMVAVAVASVAIGSVVYLLIARTARPGALIGMSLAAVAASWWVDALVLTDPGPIGPVPETQPGLSQWLPAILCGAAIAWCGIHGIGRVLAAITALTVVVIGPALATAVTAAAATRALMVSPAEMLSYGVRVFQQELLTPEVTLRPIVTVLVVAAAGLTHTAVLRRQVSPDA